MFCLARGFSGCHSLRVLIRLVVFAPLLMWFGCGQREITYERSAPLTLDPVPSSTEQQGPVPPSDAGDQTEGRPPPGGSEHPSGGTAPPPRPPAAEPTGGGEETPAPTDTCALPNCGCFGHQDCPTDRFCFLNRCVVSRDCADCRSTQSVCVVDGDRAVCGSCDENAMYSCAQYLPERRYCDQGRCVCRRAEDCGYGGWCVEGDCIYASGGFVPDGKDPPGGPTGDNATSDSSLTSSSSSTAERDAGVDASLQGNDAAESTDASEMTWR